MSLVDIIQEWISPTPPQIGRLSDPHSSPTRRPLAECEGGYERLLKVPGFWEGRAKVRRDLILESQTRLSEQDDEWLRISLSSQQLRTYEEIIQNV